MIKRVIVLKNNIPLINRNYEPESSDSPSSLGAFQAIVDTISGKVLPGLKNEEQIANYRVIYQLDESILFVIGSDMNEVGVQEIFLDELKNLFYAVFPKDFVSSWQGDDVSVFKGFESKLDQLRSAFENRIMTKPGSRRILDTLSVMELPQRLQKTAYAILDAKIASFEEVINLTTVTPQEAVANIQEILNAGFLYTTKVGSRVFYSIKSFGEVQPAEVRDSIAPTTESKPRETVLPTTSADLQIGLEVKKRDINRGNLPFLMKKFKKDLDKIFDTVLGRKTALLLLDPASDKNEVLLNMVLDSLQCFAPERELRIVNFTKDFIHPREADIIRIERDLVKFYSNELIIDLDNKKIMNGDNSIYLSDIFKEMSRLKHSECVSLLMNRVALIEKLAQDWGKIKKLNLPTEEFITNVRNKHNPAIIEVMEKVATSVYMD
ncbi:MAG: hypothetical protein FK730_06670 [Asgard group archaeon]|nr:hypothetical protein [Asgard group archaeon]